MKLTNQNIANVVEEIEKFFKELNIAKQDILKVCFLFEESLLSCQEKFGEDYEFKFIKKKWFGTPKVIIRIYGKTYNPIADDEKKDIVHDIVAKNFLNYEQAGVNYRYEHGYNELSVFSTKKAKKIKIPGGNTTIAFFLAIISALIMQNFPEPTQKIFVEGLVTPVLDRLFSLIIAVNIPLIFISIIASICTIENVTILHDLSLKVFKRFFVIMLFVAICSVFIGEIFFPVLNLNLGGQISANDVSEMQKIFDLILSIIPTNIVGAFLDENILQIVLLAFVIGVCITILGDRIHGFKDWILDFQKIVIEMVSIVFKIIPVIIFLCIFKVVLQDSISELFGVWKIVVAIYVTYTVLSLTFLLKNYFLYNVQIVDFLKKISPACVITFTTSSGSASMPQNIEICSSLLNIKENLCNFYIPLSHPLCPATKTLSFIIFAFFAAQFSGEQITITQLFVIIFFAIQFAISASNGAGNGMIAMYGLLAVQIGVSLDAIGAMMIADIFAANLSGVISLIIRDCDLLAFSRTVK